VVSSGFPEDKLQQVINDLRNDGFEAYLTSVGGSGVGVLSPYRARPTERPVTPPETPAESDGGERSIESDSDSVDPLRAAFETHLTSDLSHWAEEQGRWLYV
jgi:hypothetical protein